MRPLRVATWNLNGLDPADLDVRTEAQCFALLLKDTPPHVVMLQEVVGRAWHAHLKHHFAAAGLVPAPADPHQVGESDYFCALLVHRDVPVVRSGAEPFPNTHMGRHLVWAEVTWEGQALLLATSHFESTKPAGPVRVAQAAAVLDGLHRHEGPAVFGGDTNLRKAEADALEGLAGVTDAWEAMGAAADQRATWPSRPGSGRPGARFDRVWVHGADVVAFRTFGHQAPGYPLPPSDHLGLEVWLAPLP